MKANVTIEIPEKALCDLLTTAWEGGSDYWTAPYSAHAHRRGGEPDGYAGELDVMKITFDSPDGDDEFNEPVKLAEITGADIGRAIAAVLSGTASAGDQIHKDLVDNINDLGACDANTADVLLQVATFGEIVYG